MLLPQYFARMRFKHDNTGRKWDDEITRALSLLHQAEHGLARFAAAARRLAALQLGSEELQHLRRSPLRRLPTGLWGKVVDRYLLEEELTGWGLLNAGAHVLWHNESTTIQDFNHNEYVTGGLIQYATSELGIYPVTVH